MYNAIDHYYRALGMTGYYRYADVRKLLVLIFYYHFIYDDFRGYIQEKDYKDIETALNCLFGTTCLIPYMDYLKMGKLRIGDMAELLARTKAIESTKVVKGKNKIQNIADLDLTEEDQIPDE